MHHKQSGLIFLSYANKFNALRYRIITTAPPGAAGKHTFQGKPATFEGPVLVNSLNTINRTTGGIAAGGHQVRRKSILINPDQENEKLSEEFLHRSGINVQECFLFYLRSPNIPEV